MQRRFENQSILITGASSRIGKATAKRFARESGHVTLFADRAEELRAVTASLQAEGLDVVECHGDVSVAADVERAVTVALEKSGRLDVLVSNTGMVYCEPLIEISEVHWDRLMAVNLKGMFIVSQRATYEMIKEGRGVILFTSSMA